MPSFAIIDFGAVERKIAAVQSAVTKTVLDKALPEMSRAAVGKLQDAVDAAPGQAYAPVTSKYARWKEAVYNRSRSDFWNLSGDLRGALQSWGGKGGVWYAGVPGNVMESERKSWLVYRRVSPGRKRIAWYGRIQEFGESGFGQEHPERPLFRPVAAEFVSEARRIAVKTLRPVLKASGR